MPFADGLGHVGICGELGGVHGRSPLRVDESVA